MYSAYILKNGTKFDVSEVIKNLSWGDDIDTLGMDFNFSMPNKILYSGGFAVNEGDGLVVINKLTNNEIFRGIAVTKNVDKHITNINALDYAFYLNQSKIVIQFTRISASDAINTLCEKFNVPIKRIEAINVLVTKIYTDNTIAEIIVDLLEHATEETGEKYRLEMQEGKLFVGKYTDLIVTGNIRLAQNLSPIKLTEAIDTITSTTSIAEMKNSVIAVNNNKILATEQDQTNIDKYGLLQEVISIDDKNSAQARNIVKNKLLDLNRVTKTFTVDAVGDDTIRAGRLIEFNYPEHDINGLYLIKSANHSYSNNTHKVSLELIEESKTIYEKLQEPSPNRTVNQSRNSSPVFSNVRNSNVIDEVM